MPTAYVKALAKKLKVSVALVEERWETAKQIALKKFKKSDAGYYPYVTGILKNMLKVHASTSAMFASLSAETPEWWDKMGYNDQKAYLKEHKDSDLKINKKKPHNGRQDMKTEGEKKDERAKNKDDDQHKKPVLTDEETTPVKDHGGGAYVEDIEEDKEGSPDNDSFDEHLNREQDDLEVADQSDDAESEPDSDEDEAGGDSEQSKQATKNMAHVGEKTLDDEEEDISKKVHIGMGKAFTTGTKAYLKAVVGGKLDEVEEKSAMKLGNTVSAAMFTALAGIALFTPLAPFALVIGTEYMSHKMGNKDNLFDKAREERQDFLERHRKGGEGEGEEKDDEDTATVTEKRKKKDADQQTGERAQLVRERRELIARIRKFPKGDLDKQQARFKEQLETKLDKISDRIDELEPSHSSDGSMSLSAIELSMAEWEAFAGSDDDVVKRMTKDLYHNVLTTNIPTLAKLLKKKYPKLEKK